MQSSGLDSEDAQLKNTENETVWANSDSIAKCLLNGVCLCILNTLLHHQKMTNNIFHTNFLTVHCTLYDIGLHYNSFPQSVVKTFIIFMLLTDQ